MQGIQIEIFSGSSPGIVTVDLPSFLDTGTIFRSDIIYENETGNFYGNYNPSGFINGNVILSTGDQTKNGDLIFSDDVIVSGAVFANTIVPLSMGGGMELDIGTFLAQNNSFSLNYFKRYLYDSSMTVVADWDNKILSGANGFKSVDWKNRRLYDGGGTISNDWVGRRLLDGVQNYSVDWQNRLLISAAQNTTIDWNNSILSGNWNLGTGSNLSTQINILSGNINTVSGNSAISTWSNLTWSATTVWTAAQTYEDRKILIMTGNSVLQINNLYNGWAGVLQTIQSGTATSGYSLTLPAATKVMNGGSGQIFLTSGSGAYDIISFVYNGTNLFASAGNNFS